MGICFIMDFWCVYYMHILKVEFRVRVSFNFYNIRPDEYNNKV